MRISTLVSGSLFAAFVALAACSSDNKPVDNDPFNTLQDCYDDHHSGSEHLTIQQAIITCCLDHPIGGMTAPTCLDTPTDCFMHVRAALDASILDADITTACMMYITDKHQ